MKDTFDKKNRPYRSIMAIVFLGLLIFGLFSTFLVKTAEASNNYFDNVKFYYSATEGVLKLDFFVKTSFRNSCPNGYCRLGLFNSYSAGYRRDITIAGNPATYITPAPENCDCSGVDGGCSCDFTAGRTYSIDLSGTIDTSMGSKPHWTYARYIQVFGTPTSSHYIYLNYFILLLGGDTEYYYFTQTPVVFVSYPFEGAEIAQGFDIQGTYSVPDLSQYDRLVAELITEEGSVYFFEQRLTETEGDINLRVSGVPAGDYKLTFDFYNPEFGGQYFITGQDINISIVKAIPFELPETQEPIPDFYNAISPEYIYSQYSNYATSTALFNNLSGTLSPLITTLGNNLSFFSQKLNQDDAKKTGQDIGGAIQTARAYASNINAFFNDLPVSDVLFFYLVLLVAVSIFRIIRQAIGLIPFT